MKRLLLIPTVILPYSVPIAYFVSKPLPEDAAMVLFISILTACFAAAPVCNVIYMILARQDDARVLICDALLVKLLHVPAYVIIFISGAIAALMIFFTLPLIFMLIAFDYVILLCSSMLSAFALIKHDRLAKLLSIVTLVCQLIFCADVISLLVLHLLHVRKKRKALCPNAP